MSALLQKDFNLNGQLSLFDDEEVPAEEIEPEFIEISYSRERKPKPSLADQFEKLPVREVIVDTLSYEENLCPECGTEMIPIGREVIRTEIEFVRPKMERVIYYATTYECPKCKETEEPQFIKDNGKPAPIPGSYVSESLQLISYIKSMYSRFPYTGLNRISNSMRLL